MMNFRMSDAEINQLDQAAKQAGMSRSAFIRSALMTQMGVAVSTPKAKASQCPQGNPRGCTVAQWQKLPTGINLCGTCGTRKA